MRKIYINPNEDLLVTTDKQDLKHTDYFEIKHFGTTVDKHFVNKIGLYQYCKCMSECWKLEGNGTLYSKMQKWLEVNGFPKIIERPYVETVNNPLYRWYDYISLSCIYGSNNPKFRFIKPFIISKTLIESLVEDYKSETIQNFQKQLVNNGCIAFDRKINV